MSEGARANGPDDGGTTPRPRIRLAAARFVRRQVAACSVALAMVILVLTLAGVSMGQPSRAARPLLKQRVTEGQRSRVGHNGSMMGGLPSRARAAVRERGVFAATIRLAGRVLERGAALASAERRWRREQRLLDREFDERHGVDTGGIVEPWRLGVDAPSRRYAVACIASRPEEFRRTIEAVPIDHREFTFVDYGSGKGRAVVLASAYPFRRVLGVEFSPALIAVAERNLSVWRGERRCGAVDLVCADAAEWEPPGEPLACYLYNPFMAPVMERVLANLRESLRRRPRPVYVFYCNPVEEHVMARETWLERVATGDLFAVYRAR